MAPRVLAGAMGAAAAAVIAVAVWIVWGGPLGAMVAIAVVLGAAAGITFCELAASRWMGGRPAVRVAAAVAVGAATVIVLIGRPAGVERAAVAAGATAVAAALIVFVLLRGQAAPKRAADRDAIDVVVGRMARAVPLDELLQQVVDALRQAPQGRAVELWQRRGNELVLSHHSPLVDRTPLPLDDRTALVTAAAGPFGAAWLRTWLPGLAPPTDDDGDVRAAPLAVHGELLGVLLLRAAPGDRPFGPDDDAHLARVQRPVAQALNDVRLRTALEATVDELRHRNEELQASRARLVSVADAERRRLERDLHDGVQAQLSALGVKLQLTRALIERDPQRAGVSLAALEDDLTETVASLRRLAHGIHPPLLLTGGLGDALRGAASSSPADVRVEPIDGTRFRPELEAAVYYCCVEALQNVTKHAGRGARAVVRVEHDRDTLSFSVTDDGAGIARERVGAGHGLINMADRMGAVGGTVAVEPRPGGGTVVRGQAPIAPPSPDVPAGPSSPDLAAPAVPVEPAER